MKLKQNIVKLGGSEDLADESARAAGCVGGADELENYAQSEILKTKELQLKELAAAIGPVLGKPGLEKKSPQEIRAVIERQITPGKSQVSAAKQEEFCNKIVDALNKLYGRQVIPLAEGVSVKCDRAKELLKSMLTANYAEFLTVSHELQSNMQALQKLVAFLGALQKGMLADLEKDGSNTSVARVSEFRRISDLVIDEFQRKIAIISNALSIGVGSMKKPIDLTFKNFEPLDAFYKSLEAKGDEKASNVGQRMVGLIGTVGLITSISAMVKDALKDVGMSVAEYGKVTNMEALDRSLESKLVAMKSQLDSKSLDAFLRAAELLRKNNFHHSNIMQYLKSEGGAEPRDNIHGGGESLTRRLARAKKSKEMLSENMVRKLGTVLEGFAKSLDKVSQEVLSGQRELPDSNKLRDFLDAAERTAAEKNYGENEVKYLSGENQSPKGTRMRSEFIANFERVVKTAGALGLSDVAASAKAVVGVVDTFTHLREVAGKIGGNACFKAVGAAGYKVADSVERIKLVHHRSNMLQNLAMSSKEQLKLNDDYFKILGEAMGSKIHNRVSEFAAAANNPSQANMGALGVAIVGADANIAAGNLPGDPADADKPKLVSYLKHCSRVVRDFYKAVESLDMYLGDFADKVASEPHALANMNEALAQLRLIVDWENMESVKNFTDVFTQFRTYPGRAGDDPRAPAAAAPVDVKGTLYHPCDTGGQEHERAHPTFAATYITDWEATMKCVNTSACSIVPLKNVMSMVDSIGSQFSSGRVGGNAPMTVAKMWRTIQKFIVLSSFRLAYYNGDAAGRADVNTNGGNAGYVLLLRDSRTSTQAQPMTDPLVHEVALLKHSLKAMCSKVLVSVGVHCMVSGKDESRMMRPYHPIRQLLGGSEATVVPENVELYYSLGKAIQFYKKVFRGLFADAADAAKVVTLVPHWDGVFKGLMDKVWGNSDDISSIQVDALIDETNKLRKSFSGKTSGEINRKVLMAFVAEINNRVGCYVKSQIDGLKKEYSSRFATDPDDIAESSSKNYKLFEAEEYDGANAPSPSSQWVELPDELERDGSHALDHDIYVNSIKKFRDAVYRVLAGVSAAEAEKSMVASHFADRNVLTGVRRYMERVKKTIEESKAEERVGIVRNMLTSQIVLAGFSNPVPLGLVGVVSAPAELLSTLRGLFVANNGTLKYLTEMPSARALIRMGFVIRSDGGGGLVVDQAAFKRSYIELYGAASQILSKTKGLWRDASAPETQLDAASKFVNMMRNVARDGAWDERVTDLGSNWTWDDLMTSENMEYECEFGAHLGPDMVCPVAFDRLRVASNLVWGADDERRPNTSTSPLLDDDSLDKKFTVGLNIHGEFNAIIDQYLMDALDEGMGAMYKGSVERLISGSASDAIANRKGSTDIDSNFTERHPLHINMAYALRRVMLERNAKGDAPRFQLELEDIPGYMKTNYIGSASQTRYNATELLKVCVQYKTFIKMFNDKFDTRAEDGRLNVTVALEPKSDVERGHNTWHMLNKIEATLHDLIKCIDRTLADFGDSPVFGETEPGSIGMYVSEHNRQPPVSLAMLRQNVNTGRVSGDARRKLYIIRQALLGKQVWGATLAGSLEAFNASVPESYKVSVDSAKAVSDGIVALGLREWNTASDNILNWMRGDDTDLPDTSALIGGPVENQDTTAAAVFYESGILPINVHSLRGTVPLSNLYNFSYTFEKTAQLDTLGTNKLFRHLMFSEEMLPMVDAPAAGVSDPLLEMYEYVTGGMGSNYIGLLRFVYHVYVKTMTGPDYLGNVGNADAKHHQRTPAAVAAETHSYNANNRATNATTHFRITGLNTAMFGPSSAIAAGGAPQGVANERRYALGVLDTMYTRLTFCTINMQAYLQAFILRELQRSMSPVASGAMKTLSTYVTSGDDGNSGNAFFGRLKIAKSKQAAAVDRGDEPTRMGGLQDATPDDVARLERTSAGGVGGARARTPDDVRPGWSDYIKGLNRLTRNDGIRNVFATYLVYLAGAAAPAVNFVAHPNCDDYMRANRMAAWRDAFKTWVKEQDEREAKVAKLRAGDSYEKVVTKAVKNRLEAMNGRLKARYEDIPNMMTTVKLTNALNDLYTLPMDEKTIYRIARLHPSDDAGNKTAIDNYMRTNVGALRKKLMEMDVHTYEFMALPTATATDRDSSNVIPIPEGMIGAGAGIAVGYQGAQGPSKSIADELARINPAQQNNMYDNTGGGMAMNNQWIPIVLFTSAMYSDVWGPDDMDVPQLNKYFMLSKTLGDFDAKPDDWQLDIKTLTAASRVAINNAGGHVDPGYQGVLDTSINGRDTTNAAYQAGAADERLTAIAEEISAKVYGYKAFIYAKATGNLVQLQQWLKVNKSLIGEYLDDTLHRISDFDIHAYVQPTQANMGVMLMSADATDNHPLNTTLMLALMYEKVNDIFMMTAALKSLVRHLSRWATRGGMNLRRRGLLTGITRYVDLLNDTTRTETGRLLPLTISSVQNLENTAKEIHKHIDNKLDTDNYYYQWLVKLPVDPGSIVQAVDLIYGADVKKVAAAPGDYGIDTTVFTRAGAGADGDPVGHQVQWIKGSRPDDTGNASMDSYAAYSACIRALFKPGDVSGVLADYMNYVRFRVDPGSEIGIPPIGTYEDVMADKKYVYNKWEGLSPDMKNVVSVAIASVGFLAQREPDGFNRHVYNLACLSARTTKNSKLAMLAQRSAHTRPAGGAPNLGNLEDFDNVILNTPTTEGQVVFEGARTVRAIQTWIVLASKSDDLHVVSNLHVVDANNNHIDLEAANVNTTVSNLVMANIAYRANPIPAGYTIPAFDPATAGVNVNGGNLGNVSLVNAAGAMAANVPGVVAYVRPDMGLGWNAVSTALGGGAIGNAVDRNTRLAGIINLFPADTQFSMPR